ncbi:MAG: iron-containing alcohol dehydrogenase [Candidatus Flexifilum sp.]|jgi:glycerol-1-phosphate dehydrogenase [NAD(P)+]
MTTIQPLPQIEITSLTSVHDTRPAAVVTGERSWGAVSALIDLNAIVQAEPYRVDVEYLEDMAQHMPREVEVVYGVGGGLACDVAKYLGYATGLPTILIPTALSNDGPLTTLVAARQGGTVHYVQTGPASKLIIDWDVIRAAPAHVRGAAITELLTIVTALLDWRLAAERNKTTPQTRFTPWAAGIMAGIAQQAFKIAPGVGRGQVESLRNLLDLLCLSVQLTNQMGHNRPQEGSEQFFAYAVEAKVKPTRPFAYADIVAPGILVAAAMHHQDVNPIRDTLLSAGIRLDQLEPSVIEDTIKTLPQYVLKHNLPYSILNEIDMTAERVEELMRATRLKP